MNKTFFSVLKSHRESKKLAFETKLEEVLKQKVAERSKIYSNIGRNYKITVINDDYRTKLSTAIFNSYALNAPISSLFDISENDRYYDKGPIIEHFFKTGTYIMLIENQTDDVVAGIGGIDLCEIVPNPHKNKSCYPSNVRDKKQAIQKVVAKYLAHNVELKTIIQNKEKFSIDVLNAYYGKWCEGTCFFATKSVKKKGIAIFLGEIWFLTVQLLGYDYMLGITHNSRTQNFVKMSQIKMKKSIYSTAFTMSEPSKVVDIVLNDGSTVHEKYFNSLQKENTFKNSKQILKLNEMTCCVFIGNIKQIHAFYLKRSKL